MRMLYWDFHFPDFALVQVGQLHPWSADVFVRSSETAWPGTLVYVNWKRQARQVGSPETHIKLFCRHSYELGIGKREALNAIGRMVGRRKHYGGYEPRKPDGQPMFETVVNASILNHDEVSDLLLSIAKDL